MIRIEIDSADRIAIDKNASFEHVEIRFDDNKVLLLGKSAYKYLKEKMSEKD